MEQMVELLKAMLEKKDANLKEIKEDIKTNQEEMLPKMEANQERMMAKMHSQLEKIEVCLGKMEAMDLEVNPEEAEFKAILEEVPLKKQFRDQHIAIRRYGQLKKWTQGHGRSLKKLAAARRGMMHHARMAQHKGCGHKGLMVKKN
jgi:hypothetical protein